MKNLLWIALTLFLLMDAIGNVPFFIAFLKKVTVHEKKRIIFREMMIALGVILLFNFLGDALLSFLHLSQETIRVAGGIILFLLSLKMVFPSSKEGDHDLSDVATPFIVPLAIPLIAGPAVLATVMLYSHQVSLWIMVGAIILAWIASLVILLATPYLSRKLGKRGLIACQRLMGLILILISVQMFLEGVGLFVRLQCRV